MNELVSEFLKEQPIGTSAKNNYHFAINALQRYTLDKPLRELSKSDIVKAFSEMAKTMTPSSMNNYKVLVKRFYKWLLGNDETYPENVKWIKPIQVRRRDMIAKKLLSTDEIKAMLDAASHPRDKALVAVLYETGARRGELVNMLIRDVIPQPYGYNVTFRKGKSGAHAGPPVTGSAAKYLRNWLEVHPDRLNQNSPLWLHIKRNRHAAISAQHVNRLVRELAQRAGLKRHVHPHMFRHTRVTQEAKQLNEPTMRILHGWSSSSKTPSVYIHLNGDDAVKQSLIAKGIVPKEPQKEPFQELLTCEYCGETNAFDATFCHYCGVPLGEKGRKLVETRQQKTSQLETLLKRIEALEQKLVEKS